MRSPGQSIWLDVDGDGDGDDDAETERVPCCLPPGPRRTGVPLPAIDDVASERLADDLPPVFDAHTHVFPPRLFAAIWRWFDEHGWPIREKLQADEVIAAQRRRGHAGCLLLHYAHKPGMARDLNRFVAALAADSGGFAIGTGTVCPGEVGATDIVEEAFALGLRGLKLHCHVQAFAIDAPCLDGVYELCRDKGMPLVIHAGREPWSDALPKDPYDLCNVDRTARVLDRFPGLKLVVPHLGANEFDGYRRLLFKHDTLWLDTTMMVADYFPDLYEPQPGSGAGAPWLPFVRARPDRMLYGSDAPNLPYAWDREVKALARVLPDNELALILGDNARSLFAPAP